MSDSDEDGEQPASTTREYRLDGPTSQVYFLHLEQFLIIELTTLFEDDGSLGCESKSL